MGAVWSALLVGGGLAGALFVWLLRGGSGDTGKDGDAEQEKDAPLGGAAAPGGDQSGSSGLSPGPSRQELVTKSEHLQESNGHLISKTKDLGSLQAAACRLQNPSREVCDNSREHVPSGQFPDTDAPATSETGNSRSHSEVSRNESLESPMREWGFQKGRETSAKAATCFAEKLPSSNLLTNRAKEEMSLSHLNSQDRVDHEEWEMVSRHSSWGDVGSLEAPVLSPKQGMDNGRSTLVEARGWQLHGKTEKVAVMPAGSQQVSVRFQRSDEIRLRADFSWNHILTSVPSYFPHCLIGFSQEHPSIHRSHESLSLTAPRKPLRAEEQKLSYSGVEGSFFLMWGEGVDEVVESTGEGLM
uniref:Starch binding domain 1 n=1 Tax=Callithrix jacchus TaxID=9483 RepID=F7ISV4_CALJA